ncbi:MAG: hypothetical protein Q8930_00940 [Bacillota bacterium]|nr:hypothetical protein [Bacillota bacterium]
MSNFSPDDFEAIIDNVRKKINDFIECDNTRAIESNLNTKSMVFEARGSEEVNGAVIIGEDNGQIAVDISVPDGSVRSFILKDKNDRSGINNIIGWFRQNYS